MPMSKAIFLLAMYAGVGIAQTYSTSESKTHCKEVLGKAYREDLCREVLGSPDAVPASQPNTSEQNIVVFPTVFRQGETDAITLTNTDAAAHEVTVRRYSANGIPLDNLTKSIPGFTKTELRLNVSPASKDTLELFGAVEQEYGYILVISQGNSVFATLIKEYLAGNTLTTLNVGRGFIPQLHSERFRTTYDAYASGNQDKKNANLYFVNLSNHPIRVGICRESYPDCINFLRPAAPSTSYYTVAPEDMKVFPLDTDPQRRFLVFATAPGFSCTAILHSAAGDRHTFDSDSSIKFESPK